MSLQALLLTVIGATAIVAILGIGWTELHARRSRPVQVGPTNHRARKALAAHLDRWPDDLVEGVIRWGGLSPR